MRTLLGFALLLTACETTWEEGASVKSASGQQLCAKHRVPLHSLQAWQAPTHGKYVYLVHQAAYPYYGVAEQYCPNHIPQDVALHRGWIFQERTTVYYCPICETEFWDRLRIRNEKGAIEFAQYMLSISSHTPAKPPYQVAFQKGVWTVKCLLADGRSATVKIGEDGREISTQFPRHSSNQTLQTTAGRSDD